MSDYDPCDNTAVNPCHQVVGQYAHSGGQFFQPLAWPRFEDIKQSKQQKAQRSCIVATIRGQQGQKGDYQHCNRLSRDLIGHDQTGVFLAGRRDDRRSVSNSCPRPGNDEKHHCRHNRRRIQVSQHHIHHHRRQRSPGSRGDGQFAQSETGCQKFSFFHCQKYRNIAPQKKHENTAI